MNGVRVQLYDRADVTVTETDSGVQISVGPRDDCRSADLLPEQIAEIAHVLNKWVARFTSRA